MKLFTALLATSALSSVLAQEQRRSRVTPKDIAQAELDLIDVPAPELEERFLLSALTVTDGPSRQLSKAEIDSWTQTAHYASAIRCDTQQLKDWTCPHCVDSARVLATGGNDGSTPLWYVANNNSHIIVALAGTNTGRIESINTNLQLLALPPSQSHFPNSFLAGIRLHSGYYNAFSQIVTPIHDAIESELSQTTSGGIVVTGHSLGGAVGSILASWLLLQYPNKVTGRFFAPPRQGNQAWADYVDQLSGGRIQHMNNFNDIVPHLPPRFLDYRHYSNEVYITSWGGTTYVACDGQENKKCAAQFMDPASLFESLVPNMDAIVHSGPYAGVMMGCVKGAAKVGDGGEDRTGLTDSAPKDAMGQPLDTPANATAA